MPSSTLLRIEADAYEVATAWIMGKEVTFQSARRGYARRVFARAQEIVTALSGEAPASADVGIGPFSDDDA